MTDPFKHPNYRPPTLTPCDGIDAAEAIARAVILVHGDEPPRDALAILVAQSALETGNWRRIYNWNFGNSKSSVVFPHTYFRTGERDPATGKTVMYDPPHYQTRFRAFDSAAAGAAHHLRVITNMRFRPAWEAAQEGDIGEFSRLLYHTPDGQPYYTSASADPVKWYTDALVRRYDEIDAKAKAQSALDILEHERQITS